MTQTTSSFAALRPVLHDAMREAAALALPSFRTGAHTTARVWSKAGGSPVTEADVAVDAFLKVRLSQIEPRAAWLSEETSDDPVRLRSIAVALLSHGEPVIGGVFAPATDHFYEAVAGEGATLNGAPIRVAPQETLEGARVTGPKPFQDRLLDGAARLGPRPTVTVIERVPSLALRLARVAEGRIDLGLVSRDARDWDLAGADLIVREAGGVVCDLQGRPAVYNRPEPRHGELIVVPLSLRDPTLAALDA